MDDYLDHLLESGTVVYDDAEVAFGMVASSTQPVAVLADEAGFNFTIERALGRYLGSVPLATEAATEGEAATLAGKDLFEGLLRYTNIDLDNLRMFREDQASLERSTVTVLERAAEKPSDARWSCLDDLKARTTVFANPHTGKPQFASASPAPLVKAAFCRAVVFSLFPTFPPNLSPMHATVGYLRYLEGQRKKSFLREGVKIRLHFHNRELGFCAVVPFDAAKETKERAEELKKRYPWLQVFVLTQPKKRPRPNPTMFPLETAVHYYNCLSSPELGKMSTQHSKKLPLVTGEYIMQWDDGDEFNAIVTATTAYSYSVEVDARRIRNYTLTFGKHDSDKMNIGLDFLENPRNIKVECHFDDIIATNYTEPQSVLSALPNPPEAHAYTAEFLEGAGEGVKVLKQLDVWFNFENATTTLRLTRIDNGEGSKAALAAHKRNCKASSSQPERAYVASCACLVLSKAVLLLVAAWCQPLGWFRANDLHGYTANIVRGFVIPESVVVSCKVFMGQGAVQEVDERRRLREANARTLLPSCFLLSALSTLPIEEWVAGNDDQYFQKVRQLRNQEELFWDSAWWPRRRVVNPDATVVEEEPRRLEMLQRAFSATEREYFLLSEEQKSAERLRFVAALPLSNFGKRVATRLLLYAARQPGMPMEEEYAALVDDCVDHAVIEQCLEATQEGTPHGAKKFLQHFSPNDRLLRSAFEGKVYWDLTNKLQCKVFLEPADHMPDLPLPLDYDMALDSRRPNGQYSPIAEFYFKEIGKGWIVTPSARFSSIRPANASLLQRLLYGVHNDAWLRNKAKERPRNYTLSQIFLLHFAQRKDMQETVRALVNAKMPTLVTGLQQPTAGSSPTLLEKQRRQLSNLLRLAKGVGVWASVSNAAFREDVERLAAGGVPSQAETGVTFY